MAKEYEEVDSLSLEETLGPANQVMKYSIPGKGWLELMGLEVHRESANPFKEVHDFQKLRAEFDVRTYAWMRHTYHLSLAEQVMGHPSYQRVRELGPPIIPMITGMFREDDPIVPIGVDINTDTELGQPPSIWYWMDLLKDIAVGNSHELDVNPDELPKTMEEWIEWSDKRFQPEQSY